jgi:hypothetical protein
MFIRRIGVVVVVVVVVVVDGLGEHAPKKLFSHKKKKFRFSMTTRVRSRLAYPEDAPFPICF